jgi:hypothetical protein
MRYVLLLLAVATVVVGSQKVSTKITQHSPVRMANLTPIPPR